MKNRFLQRKEPKKPQVAIPTSPANPGISEDSLSPQTSKKTEPVPKEPVVSSESLRKTQNEAKRLSESETIDWLINSSNCRHLSHSQILRIYNSHQKDPESALKEVLQRRSSFQNELKQIQSLRLSSNSEFVVPFHQPKTKQPQSPLHSAPGNQYEESNGSIESEKNNEASEISDMNGCLAPLRVFREADLNLDHSRRLPFELLGLNIPEGLTLAIQSNFSEEFPEFYTGRFEREKEVEIPLNRILKNWKAFQEAKKKPKLFALVFRREVVQKMAEKLLHGFAVVSALHFKRILKEFFPEIVENRVSSFKSQKVRSIKRALTRNEFILALNEMDEGVSEVLSKKHKGKVALGLGLAHLIVLKRGLSHLVHLKG